MDTQAAGLSSLAALIWLGGNRPHVNAADIAEAISITYRVPRDLFRVVPHHPEDFFVRFDYPHHRDQLTAPGRFRHNGLDIHSANWSVLTRARAASFHHHVHLCLEEVPLQAWDADVVQKIIGNCCINHYLDVATVQREDAASLNLWAWCSNPSAIPKVMWVTIVGNEVSVSTSAVRGRRGHTYRVIIHLDRSEDYTPSSDGHFPSRPHSSEKFDWRYAIVDGEAAQRDRQPAVADNRRRDDGNDRDRGHEDNARGRRGEDGGSWRDRFFAAAPARPIAGEKTGAATIEGTAKTGAATAMVVDMDLSSKTMGAASTSPWWR